MGWKEDEDQRNADGKKNFIKICIMIAIFIFIFSLSALHFVIKGFSS